MRTCHTGEIILPYYMYAQGINEIRYMTLFNYVHMRCMCIYNYTLMQCHTITL